MSYDIRLEKDGEVVLLEEPNLERGGMYALGGTNEAWLNVTYNYAKFFYSTMGDKGIRSLYGVTAKDSIPMLKGAIGKLKPDFTSNYWDATEGNAQKALQSLLAIAEKAPADSAWSGD